jgi:hypothetical protein
MRENLARILRGLPSFPFRIHAAASFLDKHFPAAMCWSTAGNAILIKQEFTETLMTLTSGLLAGAFP